jgi:ribosome-binding ATPase YchF (GTP1/OBG family)
VEKKARSGEKESQREMELILPLLERLSGGDRLRALDLPPSHQHYLAGLDLLTAKPVLYVANLGEEGMTEDPPEIRELVAAGVGEKRREGLVKISSRTEAELLLLDPEERQEFLSALGWTSTGLQRMIRAAYGLLDLITFFTANEKEARAWTVPRGTRAPQAAGRIHSDFERGFIRAETIGFQEFSRIGSLKAAREAGAIRSEGREYEVRDGDLVLFRFNV